MLIRHKIALLFCLLVSIILALTGISVYYFNARERDNTFRLRLQNRAFSTAETIAAVADSNNVILSKLVTTSIASLNNKSFVLLDYYNKPAYAYSEQPGRDIVLTDDIIQKIKLNGVYYFNYRGQVAVGIHFQNADNNFIVAITAEDTDGHAFLAVLKWLLIWSFIIALIISFFAGLVFAKTLLRPLSRIIGDVNLISSNNLSQRITESSNRDELAELIATFNNLLDRIQESFIIQRRFISNASHELSTPLTAISSQLEVSLQKERSAEDYKTTIVSVQEDIKHLQLLTRSLLDIAKTGTQGSISLEDVRIDELLLKLAADVQKLQKGYQVEINFINFPEDEQELTIFGNNHLLYIAIKNLLENGCKYAIDNTAHTAITFSGPGVAIEIVSRGEIIAAADIDTIFEPFFRSESAHQKQGFGLGLTLTKRILSLHHAAIRVTSSAADGTRFSFTLPRKP